MLRWGLHLSFIHEYRAQNQQPEWGGTKDPFEKTIASSVRLRLACGLVLHMDPHTSSLQVTTHHQMMTILKSVHLIIATTQLTFLETPSSEWAAHWSPLILDVYSNPKSTVCLCGQLLL